MGRLEREGGILLIRPALPARSIRARLFHLKMPGARPGKKGVLLTAPPVLSPQPDDDVNACNLETFRRCRCFPTVTSRIRNVKHHILALDEEMTVCCHIVSRLGFEPSTAPVAAPNFRELVQRVVDGCQRHRDFRARRFFVKHFGGEVTVTFAEQDPTQSHALSGRTQTDLAQHGLDVVPRTAGESRPIG